MKIKQGILLCGILFISIIMRTLFPTADPPADLSWSGGYYSDEGFWVHNARNKIEFSASVMDDWNNMYMSPVVHLLSVVSFRLFGVGIVQCRLIAFFCSALAMILLADCVRRMGGMYLAIIVSAIYGFNFIGVMYNRLMLLETPLTLFVICSFYCGMRAIQGSFLWYVLSGIWIGVSFITKFTSLFMLPVMLLIGIDMLKRSERRKGWYSITAISGGFLIVTVIWFFVVYSPHHDFIAKYNNYYRSQQVWRLTNIIKNGIVQPLFLYMFRSPLFLLISLIGALKILADLLERRSVSLISVVAFGWFLIESGAMAIFGYRPFRYYVPILPAMSLLAIPLFYDQNIAWRFWNNKIMRIITIVLLLIVGGQALVMVLLPFLPMEIKGFSGNPAVPRFGAAVFLVAILSISIMLVIKRPHWIKPLLLWSFIGYSLCQYGFWVAHRHYDVEAARAYLRDSLAPTVIAGQWAPQLCLGTPHKAVPLWKEYVNDVNPFQRFGITHILSWHYPLGDEYAYHQKWYPETFQNAKVVKRFNIKESEVILSEVQ